MGRSQSSYPVPRRACIRAAAACTEFNLAIGTPLPCRLHFPAGVPGPLPFLPFPGSRIRVSSLFLYQEAPETTQEPEAKLNATYFAKFSLCLSLRVSAGCRRPQICMPRQAQTAAERSARAWYRPACKIRRLLCRRPGTIRVEVVGSARQSFVARVI